MRYHGLRLAGHENERGAMMRHFAAAENLKHLMSYHTLEYELLWNVPGWIPSIPEYALKCQIPYHLFQDADRTQGLRARMADFGLVTPEMKLAAHWRNLVRHLLAAPDHISFVWAYYRVIKTELARTYQEHLWTTLCLNDAPTVELLEDAVTKLNAQIKWGQTWLYGAGYTTAQLDQAEAFADDLAAHIAALGGLFKNNAIPEQHAALAVYPRYDRPDTMVLEKRFVRQGAERIYEEEWGQAVNNGPITAAYTHFTELPIIDVVAVIIFDGRDRGLPFDYLFDFTRQLWDEVRHTRMGYERLLGLGIDPYTTSIPLGHYTAFAALPLLERVALLTQVAEACSFKPKRLAIKMACTLNQRLCAVEHDYDIVDEKAHVRFGKRWIPALVELEAEIRPLEQLLREVEWKVREHLNELKKAAGEAWQDDLGTPFMGCGSNTPINLLPRITA